MLHEILLALAGHPGDIVVPKRTGTNSEICGFECASDITFISEAEKAAIDQTCNLGYYYCLIEEFVGRNLKLGVTSLGFGDESKSDAKNSGVGLYVRALCVGLDELLDTYRAALLKAEQEILNSDVYYPLSKLHFALRDFSIILPPLAQMVCDITQAPISTGLSMHGGQLLSMIYTRAITGIPLVKKCFSRLLFHCHKVFFNQLTSWLVHGLLTDPYQEFFVQRIKGRKVSGSSVEEGDMKSSGVAEGAFFKEEEGPESLLVGAVHLHEYAWNSQYALRMSMLPSVYLPVALAQKVLFIGRAVYILQHPTISSSGLIPPLESVEFAKALHVLRQQEHFDVTQMEAVIDNIRSSVTSHLWDLVVSKANLVQHLTALKDFVFLGRGEFFQTFLDESTSLLALPPGPRAARDINIPFQNAATKLSLDQSPFFKRLRFRMDKPTFKFEKFSNDDLDVPPGGEGVVCVGGTFLNGTALQLNHSLPSQSSGAWFSPRKIVDRGFETEFVFEADSSGAGSSTGNSGREGLEGFAFVLQNENLQGLPTRNCSNATPCLLQPDRASLVIEFIQQVSGRCELACYLHRRVSSLSGQAGAALVATERLGVSSYQNNLFDGHKHRVLVKYSINPEALQVFIEPRKTPILAVSVNIRQSLQLEGGKAWLGFATATSDDPQVGWSQACRVCSWKFAESGASADGHEKESGWKNLRLEYSVEPPLDLVLFHESFDRYNALFNFLFSCKRVQTDLHLAWRPQMLIRERMHSTNLAPLMKIMALRANMQFLIDNLQYYLQVDVLEVQFHTLVKKIEESKDFETVRQAHDAYLAALTTQCFLRDRMLFTALENVFATCAEFARLLKMGISEIQPKQVNDCSAEFLKVSDYLFTKISHQTTLSDSPHLAQLVMRIDYNGFFKQRGISMKRTT
mmetsp:Transcript_31424/g.61248  ORF Transcript_31424/g.61248 Transcript_31424/m.61248 type:complete len:913 (-) Transcript_31424:71-2809(-)